MAHSALLSRETDRYHLVYSYNERASRMELVLSSKAEGRHRAIHTHFNVLDDAGRIIDKRPITPDAADFILRHFEQRGDTVSFNIYESDLVQGALSSRRDNRIRPEDVRHTLTVTEKSLHRHRRQTGRPLAHLQEVPRHRDGQHHPRHLDQPSGLFVTLPVLFDHFP